MTPEEERRQAFLAGLETQLMMSQDHLLDHMQFHADIGNSVGVWLTVFELARRECGHTLEALKAMVEFVESVNNSEET